MASPGISVLILEQRQAGARKLSVDKLRNRLHFSTTCEFKDTDCHPKPELIGPYRTSTRIYQLEARILPHRLAVSVQENITVSPARLEQSSQLLLSLPDRPSIERRAQIDAAMYSEVCPLYDAIGEGSMHQRGALGHDAEYGSTVDLINNKPKCVHRLSPQTAQP